jgi:DNA-binding CsgD family transcriptional regulator
MRAQAQTEIGPGATGLFGLGTARPWSLPTVPTPYIYLTEKESALLELLASNARKTVGNDQILNQLFANRSSQKNTLEVHVRNLRKKMRLCPDLRIDTVLNQGYMLSYIGPPIA